MYTVACTLREKGLLGYQKSDESRVGAAETESLLSAGSYCWSKYFVFVNIIYIIIHYTLNRTSYRSTQICWCVYA